MILQLLRPFVFQASVFTVVTPWIQYRLYACMSISQSFCVANYACNIFLYCFCGSSFRKELVNVFLCQKKRQKFDRTGSNFTNQRTLSHRYQTQRSADTSRNEKEDTSCFRFLPSNRSKSRGAPDSMRRIQPAQANNNTNTKPEARRLIVQGNHVCSLSSSQHKGCRPEREASQQLISNSSEPNGRDSDKLVMSEKSSSDMHHSHDDGREQDNSL